MTKRLTYKEHNGTLTAYLGGHKKGTIQPHDRFGVKTGAWLHTGNYDRDTGELIDCACTMSFRSVEAAKRYLSGVTLFERMTGAE